ncbi:flagellar protein FlaG [Paenibacillus sp. An7]|uniref:flagellar protein FlaG n=1 Tax=Paenibacillus sp. An7 TaxID=2689577 RepID=UPI00135AFFC9|nr:flagellar protein FlaG [Paenibacillus sp. An7]
MNVQFLVSAGSTTSTQQNVIDIKLTYISKDQVGSNELQPIDVKGTEEHFIRNIERAMKVLEGPQTTLDISIHEKTHDIMVKVLNKETGELIREIPPEKILDLVAEMMDTAGLLIDKKI